MVLTSFNGHPAVKCQSVRDVNRVLDLLQERGFGARVKIIKAKPKRYARFFLVFPYGVKQRGSTESPPSVEELHTH